MLGGIWRSVIIAATVLAYYTMDVWLIRRYDRRRAQGSARSWDYTLFSLTAGTVLIIQPVAWPALGLHTAAWWGLAAQVVGLALILGALTLIGWARTHLGQFFGEREEIQPGQYVIQSGPYAHIRHPIYTAVFGLAAGLLLVNPALPTLLAAVYAWVDFSLAARREDKLLIAGLPGYAEYAARTPRFLPRLRRRVGRSL